MAVKKTTKPGAKSPAKKAAAKKSVAKKSATKAPAKKAVAKKSPKPTVTSAEQASNAIDEQLERYRSMRNFGVTAEPAGAATKADQKLRSMQWPFCIQKHAASHLHYDFRLGWNNVLKSWAVSKGPSYVVADKRLAVQVEDHPMEYGGFEGIIPKGQYGGGTVMLWDQGTWEPQAESSDIDAALAKGSLKFILHGEKLKGKWALIRMGKASANASKPQWLLIKEHDPFERPPTDPGILDESPNSVATGRTMEQIAASEDHVWNSKDTRSADKAWYRQDSRASPAANNEPAASKQPETSKQPATHLPSLTHLPKESQPTFLDPQLAQQAEQPPASSGWLHELKLDGYRIQARKSGSTVTLLTRSSLDWTHRMPDLAREIARIPAHSATLDGEVVVLLPDGTTSFAALQAAFQQEARHTLTYFAFDLLHLDGHNTRNLPLRERKALLEPLLASADPHILRLSDHLETDGPTLFHNACKMRAEGIVSKLATSKYVSGRSAHWLKCKCLHEQELVIGGFTLPSAGHTGMHGIGALLLGYYEGSKLIYAGRTGTGFSQKTHKLIRDKLDALTQSVCPFTPPPATSETRGAIWVKPTLVAQVRFATWTADLLVRQAAFLGLREDKPASEVTRETTAPSPKKITTKSATKSVTKQNPGAPGSTKSTLGIHLVQAAKRNPKPATSNPQSATPTIRLTHPEKILDPESSLTKQQLADYYLAIAPHMLPHIADRPISLVRCPDGVTHQSFFQKHVNATLPPGIGSVDIADKHGKTEPYITLSGPSATPTALASLAQLGVLEIHPWGSSNASLEHPDRLIFDLDPDTALPWSTVVAAALEVRDNLKQLGLTSFLKTTGGKGLHVVVPITPSAKSPDWPAAKDFAHRFVLAMEQINPTLYLTKMTKAARTGKVYLDYLRNERGATAVAPYSPRARVGVNVSMPLAWTEITAKGAYASTRPDFSIANFASWQPRLKKDPWQSLPTTHQSLSTQSV